MEFLVGLPSWLFALMIFFLRVADMSLDTIRVLFVVRGKNHRLGTRVLPVAHLCYCHRLRAHRAE